MAKATSFDRLCEEYDAGSRCNLCRQPVTARGCACSLARIYSDRQAEAMAWYDALPDSVKNPKRGFRALPAMLSALTAERTKAGLHDLPLDPNDPRGVSVATDERLGLYAQVGIDPKKTKWRKSDQGPAPRPHRRSDGVNPPTSGGVGGRSCRPTKTIAR